LAERGRTSRDRTEAWRERQRRRAQRDGAGDPPGQPEPELPVLGSAPPQVARPPRRRYPRRTPAAGGRSHSERRSGHARLVAVLALLLAVVVVVLLVIALVPTSSPTATHHIARLRTTNVTIIPGRTRRELDALLRSQGVKGSYLKDTRTSPLLNPRTYGAPAGTHSLEGFLFPDTYNLREPLSIPALVADQLQDFKQKFKTVNLNYARQHHLTPYDVLTIASMVEAEAATPGDMARVASVIYNRLRLGMPLQIDATTRYATGNYTRPLTEQQLKSPSPYNTRTHTGLTPTPIDSPGLTAIQAAAHPAHSDYLYFVVKPCGNGALVFSSNYQQFLADSARYQQERAKLHRSPTHC
jgi:UPF0755 protein